MPSPSNPEFLAFEIGLLSYTLIYLGGLSFFAIKGVRKGIPGGVTMLQILLCGAASLPASSIVFIFAALILLGKS